MTAIDPAAVHSDPDCGIRWDLYTGEVVRADPVISVNYDEMRRLIFASVAFWCPGWHGDPVVTPVPDAQALPSKLLGVVTRWTFTNAERLYRIHSYDRDTDCFLLVWPD